MNPPTLPGGRPSHAADGSSKRSGINDRRITSCKRCQWGIFADQPSAWSRNPLGLVHTACPDHVGLASEQIQEGTAVTQPNALSGPVSPAAALPGPGQPAAPVRVAPASPAAAAGNLVVGS